jgi:hypothetical protein
MKATTRWMVWDGLKALESTTEIGYTKMQMVSEIPKNESGRDGLSAGHH